MMRKVILKCAAATAWIREKTKARKAALGAVLKLKSFRLNRRTGRRRIGRIRKLLRICTAMLLAGLLYGIGANGYIWAKTRRVIFVNINAAPKKQTAIVLGARVYRSGTPSAVLRDRLMTAEMLYNANKVSKIIVSGDHRAHEYDEPNAMYRFLAARGIPKSDIFLDHAGLRTYDTMARAKQVFGVQSAIVCTQRFHLARSVYLARHHGIDAVGMVSDLRKYRRHYVNWAREFIARSAALVDAHLFAVRPRHLGAPIDIRGDGRVTHDVRTAVP